MSQAQIYIYPTDTVWGIGCDIYSREGYLEIARIKKTDANKPLSIIFCDVQHLQDTFNFPDLISKVWLEYFFLLESTLGVPVNWCRVPMPDWVKQNSEYITCRVIGSKSIQTLYKRVGNPFFTTSLNIKGESPVLDGPHALAFLKNHCPNAILISGTEETLSGSASSIIFLNNKNQKLEYEILREGRKINEIKTHLDLLHFD
jgi:L-threonylcarbamoyladenylate synthase